MFISFSSFKRLLLFLSLISLACGMRIPAVGAESVSAASDALASDTPYTAYSHSADIVPGQVLVKYKRTPRTLLGSGDYATESLASADGRPIYRLSFAEEISVTEKLEQLQQDANVEYAEPVYRVSLPKPVAATDRLDTLNGTVVQSVYNDPANPAYMRNWGKTVTELTYAAAQTTPEQRSAVVVAVVDSGVDLHHPDLAGSLVPGYDFVNDDDTPQDDNGHGTGTAGIIAARAHDASGYDGVAPGAKIMPIKVMDSEGHGDTATIIRGVQYAIDHHADIINMSLGSQIPSRAMQDIVQAATKQGILIVAAAGNDSNHWIGNEPGQLDDPRSDNERYAYVASYPAYYDDVLSVGAIEQLADSTLTIADFSNIGKVDVVAPGVHIYTTDLNGGYAFRSGTSESAPIVTGYAALLKAYNPKLTREDLMAIVKDTSRHELTDPGHTYDYANFPANKGKYVDVAMDYGRGLINGRTPFRSPRLKVIPVTDAISSDRTVTMDVYWLDLAGKLAPLPSTIILKMTLVAEDEPEFKKDSLVGVNSQDMPSGFARLTLNVDPAFPVDEAYHYSVFATWGEVVGGSNPYDQDHYSNKIEFVRRPAPPQSTLSSGTYAGTQSVILYSTEEGAESHFVLIGDNTALGGTYVPGHPIPVTEDSFLYAYSRKNGVDSEPVEFLYKITAAPVVVSGGAVGGGGGCCAVPAPAGGGAPAGGDAGAGVSQPKVTTGADGTKSAEFTPDAAKLLAGLQANSSEVTIDATTSEPVDRFTLNLDAGLFRAAKEEKKAVVVSANGVDLRIPPGTVQAGDEAKQTRLTFNVVNKPAVPDSGRYASPMYEFSVAVDGQPLVAFGEPIEVAFHVDSAQVTDPQKAGVYLYSGGERPWTYVGGSYDPAAGVVRVKLPHFSSYAVLQFDKSFADIQGHWAQREIEIMAARQIVDGMTDSEFAPEEPVTRAQFTSLLARALGLDAAAAGETSGDGAFDDVPADAWYRTSVGAAYRAGIVGGVADREFAPDEQITREQMAAMLVGAYNRLTGKTLTDFATTQEVKFTDEGTVSAWARESVRLAAGLSLMDGSDDGAFHPQQSATRAQAAAVIYRLLSSASAEGK